MEQKESANIRKLLTRRCANLGIPVSGNFELTPRCNLRCKMCYVRLSPEQMAPIGRERTAAEWLRLGREACDAGMLFLLITGGEPTLREDFPQIYEGLVQMGLSISVNTNGTLLTPALRELWHRLPPAQVNITLYGVCAADYEDLCGNPGAFDAVTDALDWLRDEGILVHLNTTIVPSNQKKWMEIEKFARDRGLELRMTTYCFPPVRREEGCASCAEYSRLSPEAAAELSIQDLYYREGAQAILRRADNPEAPVQDDCALETGEPMRCMAGRSQFWITWDGRMTPCGMLGSPTVRPFDTGFLSSWDTLRRESGLIRLCPDCLVCPERNTCLNCAAVTYAETGRFDGKPEYMCRLNKAYREKITTLAKTLRQE
ncbi:MAG: radical SAM protein [Oscillospiraceae bacterium]|nr:radical SAM protein [Oscillospiraceae bacterium]